MSYQITFNETFESSFFKNGNMDNIIMPNNLGSMYIDRNVISKDLSVMKLDVNTNENDNFSILVDTMSDTHSMVVDIPLQDQVYKYNYITGKNESNAPKNIVVRYKNRTKTLVKLKSNTAAKGVSIMIKNSFLEESLFNHLQDEKRREIEENCKDNMPTTFKFSPISRKTFTIAKEIYNSPFTGQLQDIYLQSKVYEIVYEEFTSIINNKGNKAQGKMFILSLDDIDALHKAKDIILKSKNSFSISELARKVAICEKKLNYGFKELFETTPGGMMLETKMYEAKRLLEESEHNINEVAEIIGYKYAQNFTNAFIKFFGKKPSDIMKSRNYYY